MRMKKRLTLFLILFAVILCTAGCQRVMIQKTSKESTVTAAKIPAKEVPAASEPSAGDPGSISYIQCQKDGNVDDALIDIVNQQLSLLPANLHNAFVQDSWSIYVTDMNIGETYYKGQFSQVMATTNYEEQRILIEARRSAAYESPLHEIGHWFDYYVGLPSYSEAFAAVYAAEGGVFIRSYGSSCVRDALEFFAEGFWQYIIDPDRLKSVCPGLYHFIHDQYCQLCARIAAFQLPEDQRVFKKSSMIMGLT